MNNPRVITLLGSVAGLAATAAAQQTRPNIIIVMTDQQRADLLGREGYPLETMPFADSLARQGTWFDRAYTTAPASTPARTSMLTGRFTKATHVKSNHNAVDAFFVKDMFDVANEQGYATAMVGKNHTYLTPQKTDYWSPFGHGGQNSQQKDSTETAFDNYLGSLRMYAGYDPSPGGVEMQLPYRMVDDALGWISTLEDTPFLMWFSMPEPHNPYQACEPYYSMFPPQSLPPKRSSAADREGKGPRYVHLGEMMAIGHLGYDENLDRIRSVYHGMLRMIDDQLRRLVNGLGDEGKLDNTIIVYLSDHGDYVGEYGFIKKGVGMDEVLMRIPMQWTGPGIVANAAPHDAHVSMVDIFPTVCEIMDAPIPAGVQGRSLWPLLTGREYPRREFSSVMAEQGYGGMVYTKEDGDDYKAEGAMSDRPGLDCLNTWTQSGSMRMLRSGEWKLVYDMDGNGYLYNLAEDPSELRNLFGTEACAAKQGEMVETLLRWEISTADPLPLPRNRYRFKTNPHNYLFSEK